MPFVAGIAFAGLASGSAVFTELLSHEDTEYTQSTKSSVSENLQTTFEELAKTLPTKPVQITLSLPSYLSEDERKSVLASAKAAGLVISRTFDNLHTAQSRFAEKAYGPQNELVLEISSSIANARLVSTEVEEGIRSSDTLKQIVVNLFVNDAEALISQFVDPARATLSGSELKRIVVVDATGAHPSADQLELKLADPSVQIFSVDFPSIAHQAATTSLYYYRDSIADKYIFNLAPLRVGIAKADGFVLTLIPRGHTLPQHKSAVLTTFRDGQTKARVKIVVGMSPRAQDNTTIAELILDGLSPCPTGVPLIRVAVDVDVLGETRITAEEVGSTVSASAVLKDIVADGLTWDGVEVAKDDQEEKAENVWIGQEARGALPE